MNSHHPSELRLMLTKHLRIDDLKMCALVCKAWHADFQYAYWQDFFVNTTEDHIEPPESHVERMDCIRRNAHWIKHLRFRRFARISTEILDILIDQCRSLLSFDAGTVDGTQWMVYKDLIELNTGLEQVTLLGYLPQRTIADPYLHRVLARLPRLHRLTISCGVTAAALLQILEVCPSLKVITVQEPVRPSSPTEPNTDMYAWIELQSTRILPQSTVSPFDLQGLHIEGTCDDPAMCDLLELCPSLSALSLRKIDDKHTFFRLQRVLKLHLPLLSRLTLNDQDLFPMNQVNIVHNIPRHQLREVTIMPALSPTMRCVVGNHYESLESIRFHEGGIWLGDSEAIVNILAKCSQLRNLHIRMDEDHDIRLLLRSPWVCTNLEVLEISVQLDRHCRKKEIRRIAADEKRVLAPKRKECGMAETVFWKRIGQLTRLRRLCLYTTKKEPDLSFMLEDGLSFLDSLSQLQELYLGDRPYMQDIAELQFMKQHWKKLCKLTCSKIQSMKVWQWLQDEWPALEIEELHSAIPIV